MTGATGTPPPKPDVSDVSVGELMSNVMRDLSTLVRQEVTLAKAELKTEAAKAGKGAGLLSGAGFAGYMVLLFLSLALWWALANVMDQGWAALIVAGLWAVAGGVLLATGRRELRRVKPKPEQTVETLQQVPGALKGERA
ncbi:phage holin family protein [Amycolatopsis magusensis]|uniref:phage holin family protein n=1 Tax=Amycolatopsis magusensis TaxID=882444 RepID=UPI0024A8FE3D|nr:phage holin family protein [Amycolatopsis magusensis]MDI5975680.1 phage holin family protein [Amycolatopsis magusensis]